MNPIGRTDLRWFMMNFETVISTVAGFNRSSYRTRTCQPQTSVSLKNLIRLFAVCFLPSMVSKSQYEQIRQMDAFH